MRKSDWFSLSQEIEGALKFFLICSAIIAWIVRIEEINVLKSLCSSVSSLNWEGTFFSWAEIQLSSHFLRICSLLH
ncbi:unnamed protein product [Citrullus colocynthis]|uniref:Uncharacterized protein n=1 Tax=Citrullus colocynthis TaxID=252529 RepID=A0ABP0YYD9_9ROSI